MDLNFRTTCFRIAFIALFLTISVKSEEEVSDKENVIDTNGLTHRMGVANNVTDFAHYIGSRSIPTHPGYGRVMAYLHNTYGAMRYNYMVPTVERYYNRMPQQNYSRYANLYNQYNQTQYLRSPYQALPGTYQKSSYGKELYFSGKHYRAQDIYGSYLANGAYQYYSGKCANHYGQTPQISDVDMESAFGYAGHQLRNYGKEYGNSSYSAQSPPLKLKEKQAVYMEYVTEYFAKYKCMSKYQTTTFLPSVNIGKQYLNSKYGDTSCYSSYGRKGWELECSGYGNSKYRAIDGSCNNLRHPYWGKSYVCHIRLLPPDYSDGVMAPRMSTDGSPLPNSRTVTNIVTADKPFQAFYTNMKVAFGQFFNHDLSHTPVYGSYALSSSYSSPVDCCKDRYHKQCYPIDIEPSGYDYQYRKYNNTCLNFVRSAPCPLCEIGPRQQMNIATSFCDAGTIYGHTVNESIYLREFRNGQLKTSKDVYGKPILLATPAPWHNECSPPTASMQCFVSGDQRCNQHPSLMGMHLVFTRLHNYIAIKLKLVNPYWNDDRLYNEARRILIAQLQHIAYSEYLPIVMGKTLMDYFSLTPRQYGFTTYEPYTDPSSWNEYATVACRFGHSQIKGKHSVPGSYRTGYNKSYDYWLRDAFMDPSYLWEGKLDGLTDGLLNDHSYSVDPYYTNDIKNYLMRKKGQLFGSDLISRNMHRGREHGISGYTNYLKYCFGFEVYSWEDLKRFIPEKTVNLFRHLYKSVHDVDFYIAGISEKHFPDADVGPTFACVLGIQYYHIKFGDRYWYEHGGQSGSFSPAQLDDIRKKTSLAQILCQTGDYLTGVQRYAFFPISNYNKKILCKDYPELNYLLYKDKY